MTTRMVYWNGSVLPAEDARVSVFDAGFLYGDGIYETLRAYDGRPFAWDRHMVRLRHSARIVRLALPDLDELRRGVASTLAANETPDAVARITVTRGPLTRRLDLSSAGTPSVLVTTDAIDPASDAERRRGIRVIYSKYLRFSDHPLAGVKSTNYQVSLFARNEARAVDAHEVLVPNESGDIVEAAAANVFLVEGGRLVTPPLGTGILGGITREVVIELARARGRTVDEQTLPRERLERADEVFLSGTTIQVAPVVRVGDRAIGAGSPGPVSLALLDDYLAAVQSEATGSVRSSERMR
jgi:branched-chain amino acid aminotransferase